MTLRVSVDVVVLDRSWARARKNIAALCRRWTRAALTAGLNALPARNPLKKSTAFDVSIALVSDARIRSLNRVHRGKNKPTNVLSFPSFDGTAVEPGPVMLGDVIVALQTTRAEAKAENKSFSAHAAHLVVHGVLHLLGYDHLMDRDARRMERLERLALKGLGVADPYAGSVAVRNPRKSKR
jgi:probable rRNA maturation factor